MIRDVGVAFVEIVVPVALIAGFGCVLGRAWPIDLGSLTALAVSVLVPGIAFDSLTRATLPREVLARPAPHAELRGATLASAWEP